MTRTIFAAALTVGFLAVGARPADASQWKYYNTRCEAAFQADDYPTTAVNCAQEYQELAQDFEDDSLSARCVDKVLMGESIMQAGWAWHHMDDEQKAADMASTARQEMHWVLNHRCDASTKAAAQEHLDSLISGLTGN